MKLIYYFYIAFFLGLLVSCSNSQEKENDVKKNTEVVIKPYFYEGYGFNGSYNYAHYLLIENYEQNNFNDYRFLDMAFNYLDTVTTYLPVWNITFISDTINFSKIPDNQHWDLVKKNFIIDYSFYYRNDTISINDITFWCEGEPYDIEFRRYR